MTDRIPAVDDQFRFPMQVRQRMGASIGDASTPEGAAVKETIDAATDTNTAAAIADPTSDTAAALSATIDAAAVSHGNLRLLPIGDSITYVDGGYLSDSPQTAPTLLYRFGAHSNGMFAWANAQLGHPFTMAGNAGVMGDTSEQILARIDAALAIPADIVTVLAGANDFAQGWTASRTITALTAIYAKVRAAGRRLVVLTTMSRSTMNSTAGYLYLGTVNRFIKSYARSTPGVVLADISSAMTDPATGVPYTITPFYATADGTHPNAVGAQLMGKVLADALRPLVPMSDIFSSNNNDPLNLMRNACNLGTGGTVANGITGTPGTQWGYSGSGGTVAGAVSKVARTDGKPGEWTRLVIGAGNTATLVASGGVLFGAGVLAVGDTVTCAVEVRTSGLVGVTQFAGGIYHPNSQGIDLRDTWQQGAGAVNDGTYTLMVEGHVIQAGATYAQVRVAVTATGGTVDIGRAVVLKTA